MTDRYGMVNPAIFEDLQARVDEDSNVRDELREIIQTLEKQGRSVQFVLSRAHSTPASASGIYLPSSVISYISSQFI